MSDEELKKVANEVRKGIVTGVHAASGHGAEQDRRGPADRRGVPPADRGPAAHRDHGLHVHRLHALDPVYV